MLIKVYRTMFSILISMYFVFILCSNVDFKLEDVLKFLNIICFGTICTILFALGVLLYARVVGKILNKLLN